MTKTTTVEHPDGPQDTELRRPFVRLNDEPTRDPELALALLLDAITYASPQRVTPTERMRTASAWAAEVLAPSEARGPDPLKRALDAWARNRETA